MSENPLFCTRPWRDVVILRAVTDIYVEHREVLRRITDLDPSWSWCVATTVN